MEKIVGLTKEPLSLYYLRYLHESGFERRNCLTISFAKGDKNHGGKIQAQDARI